MERSLKEQERTERSERERTLCPTLGQEEGSALLVYLSVGNLLIGFF